MKNWKTITKMLGAFVRVEGIDSKFGRGESHTQKLVIFENGEIFQSYSSPIGARINGKLYLDKSLHDYSNTTMWGCKQWCGLTAEERRQGMESGEIEVIKS